MTRLKPNIGPPVIARFMGPGPADFAPPNCVHQLRTSPNVISIFRNEMAENNPKRPRLTAAMKFGWGQKQPTQLSSSQMAPAPSTVQAKSIELARCKKRKREATSTHRAVVAEPLDVNSRAVVAKSTKRAKSQKPKIDAKFSLLYQLLRN